MEEAVEKLKAKDLFMLIEVHERALKFVREANMGEELSRDVIPIQQSIMKWLHKDFAKLMP